MQGRERFFVRAADTNTKENAMQAVLDFINNHVRDLWLPGAPTHPMTYIDGMMNLLGRKTRQ